MSRIAFIQADANGQPYSANGAVAARGFAVLGFDVRFFQRNELPALGLTSDSVVVGGMGTVRQALEQIGVRPPSHVSTPSVLAPHLGRRCWRTTLREARESAVFPVFLKPYDEAKLFTGRVFQSVADLESLLQPRDGFPPLSEDTPLLAQEPVSFVSEWRVFVRFGAILGVSFYQGDPLVFPAAGVVRIAISSYQHAPAGYSADFGVTGDGRTLLIETNDGYSLGHGGLTGPLYAELLLARWDELVANRAPD